MAGGKGGADYAFNRRYDPQVNIDSAGAPGYTANKRGDFGGSGNSDGRGVSGDPS